jgi:glycosyltransferase involved in cell wall biosynthesis
MHAGQKKVRKVFFLIPSLTGGGAERVMLHLLKHLDRSKYCPVLLLFKRKGEFMQELPDNIEVRILREGEGRYIGSVQMVYALSRLIRQENPSLLLSFTWYANAIALIATKLISRSVRLIVSERTSLVTYGPRINNLLRITVIRFLYPLADMVITPSRGIADELVCSGYLSSDTLTVIPNPIDLKALQELSRHEVEHPWFSSDTPIIIGVGRMSKEKGFDLLIRAISLLVRKGTSCRLILLGDGEERPFLESLTKELGITMSVFFLGFQQNPFKYISRSTVFVLPSLQEGFPNALLEALALGIPSVATRCSNGPEEILDEGECGVLVPPADASALADAIGKLCADKGLREKFAVSGEKRSKEFAVADIVKRFEDAIEKVCAGSAVK